MFFVWTAAQVLHGFAMGDFSEEGAKAILFWIAFSAGVVLGTEALALWAELTDLSRGLVMIVMINLLALKVNLVVERARVISATR